MGKRPFSLTPLARDDIFNLWIFIATKDVTAAEPLEEAIFDACQRVADRPDLGHWRRDLTDKPVRFFPFRGLYLLVYNPNEPVQIIRVLHGARNIPEVLKT